MLAAFSIDNSSKASVSTLFIFVLVILVKRLGGVTIGRQIPFRGSLSGLAMAVAGLISQAVGVAGLALWLLDVTHAWRPVWSVLGLDRLVYPDLNGHRRGPFFRTVPSMDIRTAARRLRVPARRLLSASGNFVCLQVEVTVS